MTATWWAAALLLAAPGPATPPPAWVLVDIREVVPTVAVDIPYARADNVAGAPLVDQARCLLRPEVAAMVGRAQRWLQRRRPDLTLLLKDCYRPLAAQRRLFAAVANTPRQAYVANPNRRHGSVHTYAAAVDVTLAKTNSGRECDLGTPFDHLGPKAEPRLEAELLAAGSLRPEHLRRRQLLRRAMVKGGGFRPIRREWWHFDALRGTALRRRWGVLDLPLAAAAPPPKNARAGSAPATAPPAPPQ